MEGRKHEINELVNEYPISLLAISISRRLHKSLSLVSLTPFDSFLQLHLSATDCHDVSEKNKVLLAALFRGRPRSRF